MKKRNNNCVVKLYHFGNYITITIYVKWQISIHKGEQELIKILQFEDIWMTRLNYLLIIKNGTANIVKKNTYIYVQQTLQKMKNDM